MRTITYDPAVYKLVPIEPTNELLEDFGMAYSYILNDIPNTLPGVVEHSGELAAQAGQDNNWYSASQDPPDDGNYIIVQPGGSVSYQGYFGHPYGQPETGWYSSGGSSSGPIIRPLHWRKFPLPQNKNLDRKYTYAGCESCACPKGICQSDFSATPPAPANALATRDSDCSVNNGPAFQAGPCTCKATRDTLLRRIAELEQQPNPLAIVKATLEAAAIRVERVNTLYVSHAEAIRALDPQAILDSVKN